VWKNLWQLLLLKKAKPFSVGDRVPTNTPPWRNCTGIRAFMRQVFIGRNKQTADDLALSETF